VVVGLCAAIIGPNPDILLGDRGSDCATAANNGSRAAVQVCRLEYQRTQDPMTGVLLAEALRMDGDLAAAKQTATQLLATPARSDALQILGQIARKERRNDDALTALEQARALHRIEQRPKQLARDDAALAMVQTSRSEFAEALQLVDECITEAQLDGDKSLQCTCHLAAAKALIRVGYWSAAEQELEIARPLATSDRQRSDLEYQRGSCAQDRGHHASAIAQFESALRLRKGSPDILWTINTDLNLAYSLAEQGKFADAQRYFEDATLLDSNHKKQPARTWVAARIAYREHELPRATSLIEKYFQLLGGEDPDDRDDKIDVATLGAQVELDKGDLKRAEFWARRGVEQAELVRGAQSTLELRPWVLAKRRAPYELLFTALARSHRVEDAAMAFDQWQGRTVQDALARPRPPASLDYRSMADQVTRLDRWLHVASQAAFARAPDRDSVLSTMRGSDLLALIVANDEVWRLTANHGPPRLERLGALADVKELADEFSGHATNVELASRLGALLLPDDAFQATREVLHVLVDGRLAGLPVAALRRGATPLIAMRPIVRVLRLPETLCVHVNRSGHTTVLADPDGKSPSMRTEAEEVAGLLHTTSETGAAATKDALSAAANDAVLHVAAHGTIGMDGAAIVLADGEMSALEISYRQLAPSLAVLSACAAASSDDFDFELAGSLAAGFLGAGSQHVVATLRSITDNGAPEITTRFYLAGGVADPARALAAVQSALAKTDNVDWPYFAVFGPDVCPEGAPDRQ
jgi:tetratricopeptide (TPR) repeat protein